MMRGLFGAGLIFPSETSFPFTLYSQGSRWHWYLHLGSFVARQSVKPKENCSHARSVSIQALTLDESGDCFGA